MHFSRQQGAAVARPAQQPVQRGSTQQSRTATKNNPQRAVPGPGGERVQMTEPQEHPVKKTVWNRVLTGATKAAKPANWKHPGRAVKRFIPHAAKVGKDSSGFNLSYYRNTFFLLNNQMQFDLYMAGLAPKMTKREVDKLRASALRIRRKYKPETVMYDAHISPSGYEAPLKDVVAEAKAAKLRAVVAAQKKKQQQAASEDALPAFPTPASYTKIQVQSRPAGTRPHQPQQAHTQNQQQHQRPSQTQPQSHLSTRPLPHLPSQIGIGIAHPPPTTTITPPQTRLRFQYQKQNQPPGTRSTRAAAATANAARQPRNQQDQALLYAQPRLQQRRSSTLVQGQGQGSRQRLVVGHDQGETQGESQGQSQQGQGLQRQARVRQTVVVPVVVQGGGGGGR